MAVYRVDMLTEDPGPVLKWIEDNVPGNLVVRKIAYKTVKGWYVKAVFKRQSDAESFHHRWYPDDDDHAVAALVTPTRN
jgi:hypothetical protein